MIGYVGVYEYFGISLVIFGHIKMPHEMLQWIYAFHMPLFFVLSGYTYRQQKVDKNFIIKKIKTIYVPFLLFALIFCSGEMSSWTLVAYGSRNALNMAGTYTVLWFLPCFFAAVILFSLLMNIGNRSKHKAWILIAGVAVMLVGAKACEMLKDGQPMIAKYGYPLNFDMALVGAVFMVAGFYFKNAIDWLNAQKQWLLLAIVAVLFVVTGFTAYMNLPESLNPACAHVEMSLLGAMVIGRLVWGVIMFCCMGFDASKFGLNAFLAGAVLNAVPGIIVQIVLIPVLVITLEKIVNKSK